jgi:hypothetical protein
MRERPYYRGSDWDGWRQRFLYEDGADTYVVCEYSFGWLGDWLAGPFDTFADADAARDSVRRQFPAGYVTPAVVAIVRT